MATPDRLSVYNRALRILGEGRLSSLSERRAVRQLLDDAWDDNLVERCLSEGLWNFASRFVYITYDPDVEPDFGYQYGFSKPDDWVRTAGVWYDADMTSPCKQYEDEAGWWWADYTELYIKYISKHSVFGLNFSLWPDNFTSFVAASLARECAPTHVKSERHLAKIQEMYDDALSKAKNTDAMDTVPPRIMAGRWLQARRGRSAGSDRGRRTKLIG